MKTSPPRRAAPRTLSADPPPAARVARATMERSKFPAWVTVVAGGALTQACHDPACGPTRADELEVHGRQGLRAVEQGRAADAIQELGVALGVRTHENTRVRAAGEAMPVGVYAPNPPRVQIPTQQTQGVPVQPVEVDGGVRAVQPLPHAPTATPQTRRPTRYPQVRGGLHRVGPSSHDPLGE